MTQAAPSRALLLHSDSQPVARAVRAAMRQAGWSVDLHHGTATHLASVGRRHPADVVLVVTVESGSAVATGRALRGLMRDRPVVFMSSRDDADPRLVYQVIRDGAAGWLTLDMDPMRIPHALDGVLGGEPAIPRHVLAGLVARLRADGPDDITRPDGAAVSLTRRERQAADLLGAGLSTAVVADVMGVTAATVRAYLATVRTKLGVVDRAEIAKLLTP